MKIFYTERQAKALGTYSVIEEFLDQKPSLVKALYPQA